MAPAGRGRPRLPSSMLGVWLAVLNAACRDDSPLSAPWPDSIDVAVLVHGRDASVEVLGVVAMQDGRPLRQGQGLLVPRDDDDRIRLLGWSKETLSARLPGLDPERWWTIDIVSDAGVCVGGSVSSADTRRIRLSELEPEVLDFEPGALRFVPGALAARALEGLAIDFPLRPNGCDLRLPRRSARLDEDAFPPDVVIDGQVQSSRANSVFGFNRLARIDAERVVTLNVSQLFLVQRGRRFSDSPSEHLSRADLPAAPPALPRGGVWVLTGLDIDPRSESAAIRTILVSAIYSYGADQAARGGGVFEVDIAPSGFLRPVRTSTTFWVGPGYPEAISVDLDGGWVAVGSKGLVVRGEADTGAVKRDHLATEPWLRRITRTAHPLARHLAGSEEGFVVLGDLRGSLEDLDVLRPSEVATSVRGLLAVPGAPARVVINTFAGGAFELGLGPSWTRVGFQTIGQLGCASTEDACGFRTLGAGPLASERAGAVYSFSDRCGDLTVVDLNFRCASALSFGLENMTDLDASYDILTTVGDQGRILEMFLDE